MIYEAVQPDIATGIGEFLLPFLESMAPLVEAVRGSSDISLLLFQLMASCAKHLLPYLNDKQCQPFLKVALDLLKGEKLLDFYFNYLKFLRFAS